MVTKRSNLVIQVLSLLFGTFTFCEGCAKDRICAGCAKSYSSSSMKIQQKMPRME